MISVAGARSRFDLVPGYLNAASLGLPTRKVAESMTVATDDWRRGEASPAAYDQAVTESGCPYADLVGVPAGRVAVGSQVSVLAGMVASSLPDGARVVCVEGDFSSVIFPFLVHAGRGVTVRQVPINQLADEFGPGLVSFSLVMSACGSLVDTDAVVEAAHRAGALTLCDLTQAARFDITAGSASKWLCAPHGSAFMTVSANVTERIRPESAGWYAGQDIWASVYGPEMHLAHGVRRFDASPAWLSWASTVPALRLFAELDMAEVRDHDAGLADQLRTDLQIHARQRRAADKRPARGPRILPSRRVADHLPRLPGGGARARRGPDHPPRPLSAREARGGTATPGTVATRDAVPRPIVIMHGAAGLPGRALTAARADRHQRSGQAKTRPRQVNRRKP